ncbi:unnamed protein product [Brachionus calyciflorus]|uniref:KIX domain-containing protein n=1 Tax=Brachionus calyciflorus TaxID=104777 RepID=A0A813M2R3_9BILA|nr:unnamed protein product [Brachionus calyciflorus]
MPSLIHLILPRRILPQQPKKFQSWHEFDILTTDMRRYSIQKLILAVSPTQDPKIFTDRRYKNIVNYGVRIECEIYDQANDLDDYHQRIDEKIIKVKEERPIRHTFFLSNPFRNDEENDQEERRDRNMIFQRILMILNERDLPGDL